MPFWADSISSISRVELLKLRKVMMTRAMCTDKLALCLLTLLWGSSLPVAEAKLLQKIDLDGRSFALSADVSIASHQGKRSHYTTEEFHSAWQYRSRVNYQIEGPLSLHLSRRGTIYSVERQLFKVDRLRRSCKRVTFETVDQALNVDFVKLRQTKHHIGTARLLLFIQENFDKFEEKLEKNNNWIQDIITGKSNYEAQLDGGLTISVLYEQSSALSLPLGVPSRVLVKKCNEFTMLLKFMRIVPLEEEEFIFTGSSSPSVRHAHLTASGTERGGGSGDLLFDMLAVERAYGCSSDSETSKDFLGQLADTTRYRFSFRARLESEALSGPYELAVGYEPELQTLRVDRHTGSRYSHTLVSYRHDRLYHTFRRRNSQQDHVLDNVLKVTQDDELNNDVSCVVLKAGIGKRLTDACENPHSLGEMLLGATQVTYLGLARVRGIEAYAFEATGSQMPVWLEQPPVYRPGEASSDLKWRRGELKRGTSWLSEGHTTVFYFAKPGGSNKRSMIRGNKLLFMEIFKKTRSGQLYESYTVSIFDFTWQIKAVAPSGQRTEDFYSLGDECLSAATEDNHYARINLQLKGTLGEKANNGAGTAVGVAANEWLAAPVVRNLALMRAFYEQLGVPPTLAYDVESKYWINGGGGSETTSSMSVTMLAAERPESPVELTYLGNGFLKLQAREEPIVFTAFCLEICYLVAAHSRKNTLLGWNEFTSRCHMYHREQPDSRPEAVFQMDKAGPMEIYRVVARASGKLVHDDYITKLDNIHERLISTGRLLLADPAGEVNGAGKSHDQEETRAQAYFGIGHLEVMHLNQRSAYDHDEQGGRHLYDINKFPGLGLVSGDTERNKVVVPKKVHRSVGKTGGDGEPEQSEVAMNFERCLEACLIDFECRSFSTCIVEGKLQCVLSTVDFRAASLVAQLASLQDAKSKLGTITRVSLGEQAALADAMSGSLEPSASVLVRKHPTCELHNKLYTSLFSDGGSYKVNLQDRLLQPAAHPEQCAQKCYETTLATMRDELVRFRARKEKPDDHDNGYAHSHCAGYFYLPQAMAARDQLEIEAYQLIDGEKEVDNTTRGYCLLERGMGKFQKAHRPSGELSKSQVVELRQFNLDFSNFYEKIHGLSLVETAKSHEEAAAYTQVNYMRNFEPDLLELVRAFMERGGNTGSTSVTRTPANCARLCFIQLTPLWPACRSFEYIEVIDKITARKNAFCAFNTATLLEARTLGEPNLVVERSEDQGRVRGFSNDEFQVWHYEPRDELVAGSLAEVFQVSIEQAAAAAATTPRTHVSSKLSLSPSGMFLLICIVMIAGLVVGARIGHRSPLWIDVLLRRTTNLLTPGGRQPGDDKERILVESVAHIKVEDIVRAEQGRVAPEEPYENGQL